MVSKPETTMSRNCIDEEQVVNMVEKEQRKEKDDKMTKKEEEKMTEKDDKRMAKE
jgi:hypothetical protein